MSEIRIRPLYKTWLALISGGYFVPLLFADPLQVIKVLKMTFGNSNLQLPLHIFYGIKVWRLARPLQDLNVLLLEPLICCLSHVFWVIVILEYPSTTHFQYPGWLQMPRHWGYMAPSIVLLMWCSCPVSLAENTPPKHNVSTSMFDSGDVVLGVIPPPNMASWVDAKELDFGLILPQHFHSVQLFGLGHGGEFWIWSIVCFCGQVSLYR